MKKRTDWLIDVIRYSVIWMFGLGIATVIVAPLYAYLLERIGGWVYLIFIILGFFTKLYFAKTKVYKELEYDR